jgi:hypothetical protein
MPGCAFPVGGNRPATPQVTATTTCGKLWQMYQGDLQNAREDGVANNPNSLDMQAAQIARQGYDAERCPAGGAGLTGPELQAQARARLRDTINQNMGTLRDMARDRANQGIGDFARSVANAPNIDSASAGLGAANSDISQIQADADANADAQIAKITSDPNDDLTLASNTLPTASPGVPAAGPADATPTDEASVGPATDAAQSILGPPAPPPDPPPAAPDPAVAAPAMTAPPANQAATAAGAPDASAGDAASSASQPDPPDGALALQNSAPGMNLSSLAEDAPSSGSLATSAISKLAGSDGSEEEEASGEPERPGWLDNLEEKGATHLLVNASCDEGDDFCGSNLKRTYTEAFKQFKDTARGVVQSLRTFSLSKYLQATLDDNMARVSAGAAEAGQPTSP